MTFRNIHNEYSVFLFPLLLSIFISKSFLQVSSYCRILKAQRSRNFKILILRKLSCVLYFYVMFLTVHTEIIDNIKQNTKVKHGMIPLILKNTYVVNNMSLDNKVGCQKVVLFQCNSETEMWSNFPQKAKPQISIVFNILWLHMGEDGSQRMGLFITFHFKHLHSSVQVHNMSDS